MIPAMSDRPSGQATDQAATHTIVDAARLLGVSKNAVRKRIRRSTLPAHKEGDRWLVAIPATPAATGRSVYRPGHRPSRGYHPTGRVD
jgi:excisionase family DNA binding protein